MVDAENWSAIYDERIEKEIDTKNINSKEDLENQLEIFFLGGKSRIYTDYEGRQTIRKDNGKHLKQYIPFITNKIWDSKFTTGKDALIIKPESNYIAEFKGEYYYKIRYNIKKNTFNFFGTGGKELRRIPKSFFVTRY